MERDTAYWAQPDVKCLVFLMALMVILGFYQFCLRSCLTTKDVKIIGKEYDPLLAKQ